MELIQLNNIEKIYGSGDNEVVALRNINLKIHKGELVAIVGASGSGKSTLLNIMGALDKPTSGQYMLKKNNINNLKSSEIARVRNKYFGFVVQHFALIKDYTVFENIQIPLEYGKVKLKDRKKRISELLLKLGLQDKANKTPNELSGGQNQRVAIARALANNPEVILADEPTGALDQKTGNDVIESFINLNKEGKTVIIITHDPQIAARCNRIIKIEDGQIIEDSTSSA